MAVAASVAVEPNWLGRLQLDYRRDDGRTRLWRRRHRGPLLVQRSFYPEGPVCHSYLIHPPGGMAGGDRLELDVHVAAGAEALLTTPAATKIYRSEGAQSLQQQRFVVDDQATLEMLPAEAILHGACRARMESTFRLTGAAAVCFWDVICLGRPGSGDHFAAGRCDQQIAVWRNGVPLLHDRLQLDHGDSLLSADWGLAGLPVFGTLLATPVDSEFSRSLSRDLRPGSGVRLGVTERDGLLMLRCLGQHVELVRRELEVVWQRLRPVVMGRPACLPRIWRT